MMRTLGWFAVSGGLGSVALRICECGRKVDVEPLQTHLP